MYYNELVGGGDGLQGVRDRGRVRCGPGRITCIMRDIIDLFFIIPFGYKVRVVLALTAMTGFMFFTVKCPNPYFNTLINLPMVFASLTVATVQFNRACSILKLHHEDETLCDRHNP